MELLVFFFEDSNERAVIANKGTLNKKNCLAYLEKIYTCGSYFEHNGATSHKTSNFM